MKLYFSPTACPLSPHIVLRETGLPFELESVSLATKKTGSGGDYNDVNPKGYVPALLLDDGQLLTEGPVIVQYLADLVPEKHLAPPAGTMERYRLMETLNFISAELHKNYSAFFSPKASAEWKEAVGKMLAKRMAIVAEQLRGRDYLMGKDFSVADAYLFTVLRWSSYIESDLSPWPIFRDSVFQDYMARVAARPAVHAALVAEGAAK